MATKYKSEFKEKGFAPEKISNAGVQNILNEGNRQAGVLRDQFAYEKAQRDNVLSAMKSNSALEKQDRDKNFNAETKNRQQIQNRKELNFKQEQTNRTNQANAQSAVYKELAGLSKTAGKLYNELEQDKFDRDYEDQMMKIMMGEVDVVKQAKYQDDEDQLMIASVENDMSANVLGALGAKPLEQQRIRSNSKGREYANNKAQAILTMQGFQPWAENQLKEKFPQVEDPQQKREIILSMIAPYMKQTGLYGLKPEFMTAPLMEARKGVTKFFAQEDEAYTKKLQYEATEASQAGFLGDPTNMLANSAQFLRDKTIELGGDRGRALDYVFKVASENMSQEEWEAFGAMTFSGKDNPVYIDYEPRWNTANRTRAAARRTAYTNSEADDKREREAYERKMLPLLEGASDKETEMILKGYQDLRSNPGKLKSSILENYAGDNNANAVNFEGALAAKIRQAKEGMYSNAELERETDPRFAKNEELKSLAEGNSAWQEAKPVQDRSKALEELVAKQRGRYIAGSNEYTLTQGDYTVVYRLKQDFYSRVQELMNDPDKPRSAAQAAREAGEMLEQKYITQATKRPEDLAPSDQIFSNSYSPDISAEQKGPTAIRKFVVESVDKLKDQPSVLTALNTKAGLILDKPRLDAIEDSWGKAGFAYPGDIVALSKRLNISPSTIINAQRQAMQLPPLPPNPTDVLINTVRPEVRQALLQAQSSNQSIRALARTGMPYNSAAVPRNLGPTIESAANRYGIPPAILAGLIQTESSFRSGVGVISSGGAIGIAQLVPEWHPTINPGLSDVDDINYAAYYLGKLRDQFGGDLERAIYAYNAGPNGGVGLTRENREYLPKVLENAARYGYTETWKQPQSMRPGMAPKVMYIAGNTGSGAAYTGEHTDVKRTDGQKFNPTDLDQYVEVEDREKGRVPLSQVGVTGDWNSHTSRNSHGIDFGTLTGDKLYVKNGAEIVYEADSGDGNGDVVAIRTPDGIEYQFLHGKMAP